MSLTAQLGFLAEADRLKTVVRENLLHDCSRRENSAEHSWHAALAAMVLAEHAPQGVNTARAAQMLVLHDLVEIDAGDMPLHGGGDIAAQARAEEAAAERIFGILPQPEAAQFEALWREFEAAESADARYAKAIDRVLPLLANLASNGEGWQRHNVSLADIETRVGPPIARGAPALWAHLRPQVAAHFEPT